MPVAHVARAMGVSRQCAHRWVARFDAEGDVGLEDRSSRPLGSPRRTSPEVVAMVVAARRERREGPAPLSVVVGIPARTISRILVREGVPRLSECDPMTGQIIRASKITALRYERARPGELVHVDVKKLGKIPPGGGWRVLGRGVAEKYEKKRRRIGYDYVHSMVDDHSRLAYSEVLPDEKGGTCADFIERGAAWFAEIGVTSIECMITDNHFSYRKSFDVARALERLGTRHIFIKPHCPWQNGKVERFNRTLQVEWAYRQVFMDNNERTRALAPWLKRYNYERPHGSLKGRPPISRVSPT
jgi:hypothetical protein